MSQPFRLLFICTGNSARSQIAEAIVNTRGKGRVVAESAGSQPAAAVNPGAVDALRRAGIVWHGHQPRGLDTVMGAPWDAVITVCDKARETCPIFPGQPVIAHWGVPDPAAIDGGDEEKRRAFDDTLRVLARRVDLLLELPIESLEQLVLDARIKAIGSRS